MPRGKSATFVEPRSGWSILRRTSVSEWSVAPSRTRGAASSESTSPSPSRLIGRSPASAASTEPVAACLRLAVYSKKSPNGSRSHTGARRRPGARRRGLSAARRWLLLHVVRRKLMAPHFPPPDGGSDCVCLRRRRNTSEYVRGAECTSFEPRRRSRALSHARTHTRARRLTGRSPVVLHRSSGDHLFTDREQSTRAPGYVQRVCLNAFYPRVRRPSGRTIGRWSVGTRRRGIDRRQLTYVRYSRRRRTDAVQVQAMPGAACVLVVRNGS